MKKKNFKVMYILLTFLGMLTLTSCDTEQFSSDMQDSIAQAFALDPWNLLTQLLAFVVLVILVIVVGYKPAKKYLDKRKEYINGELKNAEDQNKSAKENFDKSAKEIATSHKEAMKIVDDAKNSANIEKGKIIDEANDEIAKMKNEASKSIEQEKAKSYNDVKKHIIDLTIDASSKVLEREVNIDDNKKLINDFVNEADKKDEK